MIEQMITDNGDGTYEVTFPNRSPIHVPVSPDGVIARSSEREGMWVPVIERAYETTASLPASSTKKPSDGAELPRRRAIPRAEWGDFQTVSLPQAAARGQLYVDDDA